MTTARGMTSVLFGHMNAALLIAMIAPVSAFSQTYLGDVCWRVVADEETEEEESIVRLGVLDIGGNHFTMNGYSYSTDDESMDERTLLSGNAEVFGDRVFIHLNGSDSVSDELVSIAFNAKISTSTLNGSYEGIGTIFDRQSKEIVTGVQTGMLTLITCPE